MFHCVGNSLRVFMAESAKDLQGLLSDFTKVYETCKLRVNVNKSRVLVCSKDGRRLGGTSV